MPSTTPTIITDGPEDVKAELRGSFDFVVGVLTFGAATFAVLFNLVFLAVQNDVRLQRAYLVVGHPQQATPVQVEQALQTLGGLLREDARQGGRPILCEQDADLIALYPVVQGTTRATLEELMARKTGRTSGWHELYLEKLPTARSPFSMPFLELNLLYYGWVIEVGTIIFLSQSLRKPHVQVALHRATRNPAYFLPLVCLALFIPAWHAVTLVSPRGSSPHTAALVAIGSLMLAALCFQVARVQLTAAKMNELGFHLLISSLFVQLLTAMGDSDVVYTLFSAPYMQQVRYVTWFILLCYPCLLLERWYRGSRGLRGQM